MGILYIVPTPIGHLEDITLRALRVLKEVALIAAEDTRTSKMLMQHYAITTPLTSYHEHNKLNKLDMIFEALATGDVALISDAGTPGISDPGYELIQAAIQQGYRVEPLPGANALIPALVGSGLPTDSFLYVGFMPKKQQARLAFLQDMAQVKQTLIFYESPNRLTDALQAIIDAFGPDRPVCVVRELSKLYEEFQRGTAADVLAYYQQNPPRGEITVVVGGFVKEAGIWDEAQVMQALQAQLAQGESLSQAAKTVAAACGWNKRDVYKLLTD